MKKIVLYLSILAAVLSFGACRKLDVPVESQYVKSNFPVTTNENANPNFHGCIDRNA